MKKGHINNNFVKILFIPSIVFILTFLQIPYEEVITTIPVGDSPIGLLEVNKEIFNNKFSPSQNEIKNDQRNQQLSFGFHDNNIEFGTNLNSTISNVDIPLMPLSLTQLTRGYVTNDDNTNMKSSNKETDLANHINNNQYKLEDTLTGLGNNSNNNLDLVSVKEPEKIVIQHNPETDEYCC